MTVYRVLLWILFTLAILLAILAVAFAITQIIASEWVAVFGALSVWGLASMVAVAAAKELE